MFPKTLLGIFEELPVMRVGSLFNGCCQEHPVTCRDLQWMTQEMNDVPEFYF